MEPSSVHYYQPLWTLVGGGIFPGAFYVCLCLHVGRGHHGLVLIHVHTSRCFTPNKQPPLNKQMHTHQPGTKSVRPEKPLIPSGCQLIQDRVVSFDPKGNTVTTAGGQKVGRVGGCWRVSVCVCAVVLREVYRFCPGIE